MPIPLGPDNHLLHPTAFTRSPAALETALPYTLPHPHHHHPATRSVSTPIRPLHSLWPTPHTPAYPPYFPPTMLPYYHHPTAAPPSYYHTPPPPPPPTTTRLSRRRASATPTSMSTPNISSNSKPPRLLSISQNTIRRKQKRNKKSVPEEILLEELNQIENNNLLINQDKIKRVVKSLKGRIKEFEYENQRLESQLEIAKWRLECIGIEKGLEEIETQKAIHHFLERAERAESYLKIVEMKLDNVIKSSQKNEILESSKLSTNVVEESVENIVDKSVIGQAPVSFFFIYYILFYGSQIVFRLKFR
ncbi:hypothetical protein CROQUDRAFT_527618 [Cronartium quercuum f. sp. fusiforme G11]|uniref:Uncharacterized protein n=1 Tax=Cronartium quercuum f. sp. fusiforme G11 TaxID=708437 RepID=A0A9P6TBH3_9BASI|nr:hypothetical protein CROQUDRAFT_527618 [Cronartium quercuum f. sp. fusiforme G11]